MGGTQHTEHCNIMQGSQCWVVHNTQNIATLCKVASVGWYTTQNIATLCKVASVGWYTTQNIATLCKVASVGWYTTHRTLQHYAR